MTREEVWSEINGASGLVDKYGTFFPEFDGYRVLQLLLFDSGNFFSSVKLIVPGLC